jgi:peroxiredoxin
MTIAPTYAQQRDQFNRSMSGQAPVAIIQGFQAEAGKLDALDFASRAPQVGDQAPEFVLPDQSGRAVHLSGLLRHGPVVLIFYRGEWCPYCNLQLRTFQAELPALTERGAQLVAISPQTPDHSLSMAERNELEFVVLSDSTADVIDQYGLRYEVPSELRELLTAAGNDVAAHNGETGWVLPAVGTFVIDPDGHVRYANVRGDWTERAEPAEVLAVLDQMASDAGG